MSLLTRLFGNKDHQPGIPPTQSQLKYAYELGIGVCRGIDSNSLSQMISVIEANDPEVRAARERAARKRKLHDFGQQKVEEEARWNQIADEEKWILVIYSSGLIEHRRIVRLNNASITDKGKVTLECDEMRITKEEDGYLGIDAKETCQIPMESIRWYEIVEGANIYDVKLFQQYERRLQRKT